MNEGFPLRKLLPAAVIDVWTIDLDRPLSPGANLDGILSIDSRPKRGRS